MMKWTLSLLTALTLVSGPALSAPADIGFNIEYRNFAGVPTGEGWIYSYNGPDVQDFVDQLAPAIVVPPFPNPLGLGMLKEGTGFQSTINPLNNPPPGIPLTFDAIPSRPGDEFELIARIISFMPLSPPSPNPLENFFSAVIERDTVFRWPNKTVVHVVIDPAGEHYVLFTVTPEFADQYDLTQVGSLYGLALPNGWNHFSCELKQRLIVTANGPIDAFSMGRVLSYQKFDGADLKCR